MVNLLEEHKKCGVCGFKLKDFADLKKHIHTYHKLVLASYFDNFAPKYDKYSGTQIHYKDYTQFTDKDFRSRSNMRKWIEKANKDEVIEYFGSRLTDKDYPLCQVTLATSYTPDIHECIKLYGLGNFPFTTKDYGEFQYKDLDKTTAIFIDTREKNPLKMLNSVRMKVDVGDYSIADKEVHIERKSFTDFIGTVTKQVDRFSREIERSNNEPFVILCEFSIDNVYNISVKNRHTRINAEYLIVCMKKLLAKHKNVQILFVDGRKEAARVLKRLLATGKSIDDRDLQYDYDIGIL